MLLSVPLPKSSEKQLSIILIRKMPHFPRFPFTAYAGTAKYNEKDFVDLIRFVAIYWCQRLANLRHDLLKICRSRLQVIRYCVNVPKLGDVGDAKVILGAYRIEICIISIAVISNFHKGKMCDIDARNLVFVEAIDGRMSKIFEDRFEALCLLLLSIIHSLRFV